MNCTECRERMYPADPAQAHYNYKYGWRIPSECENCNVPLSERGQTQVVKVINKEAIDKLQAQIDSLKSQSRKYTKSVEMVDLVETVDLVGIVEAVEKVENGRS